jgi:hypothetical protein
VGLRRRHYTPSLLSRVWKPTKSKPTAPPHRCKVDPLAASLRPSSTTRPNGSPR